MGLKRTPLKRGNSQLTRTALDRGSEALVRSELKRGDSTLARTKLKPRSDKRAAFMRDERIPLIKELVAAGQTCAIGPILARSGHPEICTRRIQGIHELRKRSAGGSLTNSANLMPACNRCNGWVEDNPLDARELGLVIREGHPDYERLGASHD